MAATTILALAALGFSLLSFWAIWVRRGRLLCNSPALIGWVRVPAGSVHVVLPVVLYNTGARALVVEAMELRLLLPEQQTLVWGFTRDSLSFDANERGDFARAFAVGGRESVERIVQFADPQGAALRLQPDVPTSAVLLVRFADRRYLAPVTTAMLRMPDVPITNDAMVSFAGEEYLRPLRAFWQSRMRRTLFRWRLWWDQRRHARARRS